ncbi:glycosyltransferase, partial [candidate division WOR-3 bacterium]|nr:glycosyltransferase [candidate division WOR-3 bacterium]
SQYFKEVHLISNSKNYGFSKAANIGLKNSIGDQILLLNSDVFIEKGSIKRMKQFMNNNPDIKITSPLLFSPEGKQLQILRPIPNLTYMFFEYSFISLILPFVKTIPPKYIQSAALLIKREINEKLGWFDERFFFYAEDVDFCLRARREGIKLTVIPTIRAIHIGGGSSKKKSRYEYNIMNIEAKLMFLDKHYSKVITDLIRILVKIHFSIRSIINTITSISYINKTEIYKKISLYKEIKKICRR